MKRLKMTAVLAMLVAATFLPGAATGVAAQDANLCAGALANGEGPYAGYTVVYGSGGSGSQIVLGSLDGNDYLSGGSGNDVLCAWGSGNTLDGGSGNDVLIAVDGEGNVLRGGSGNDTLMGYVNNTFDGGSGRNDIVPWEPVADPSITVTIGTTQQVYCVVWVELIDFPDGDYTVATYRNNIEIDTSELSSADGYGAGIVYSGDSNQVTGSMQVSVGDVSSAVVDASNCFSTPPL